MKRPKSQRKNGRPKAAPLFFKKLREKFELPAKNVSHKTNSDAETAYLLGSNANEERLHLALEEAESGNLPVFESTDDLLKSLREK
jgi:hypothetical protein